MKYISGLYALNLNCKLDTTGDWHYSILNWDDPTIKDTKCSFWGLFGIEKLDAPIKEGR